MIYCPNCGVANREGSKFCNECGQALGLAPGIRCPMCSVMNPEENVLCSSCGARLVPLAAPEEAEEEEEPAPVRGLSLPIKPAVEEEEIEELPELPAEEAFPPPPEAEMEEVPPEEATAEAEPLEEAVSPAEKPEAEIPDWLRELREAAPVETVPTEEITAAGELGEEEEAQAEAVEAEIPQPAGELEPTVEEEEPSAPAEAEPELREEVTPPSLEVEVREEAVEEEEKTEAEKLEPGEIPAWLEEVMPVEAEGPAETRVKPPTEEVGISDVVLEELPDWLRPPLEEERKEEEVTAEEIAAAEIPSWLEPLRPEEALRPGGEAEGLAEEPVETSGLLAGFRGVLPVEPTFALPHGAGAEPVSMTPTVTTEQARIFAEVAKQGPPVTPTPAEKAAPEHWGLITRLLLFLVLGLGAAIPFLLQSDWTGASIPVTVPVGDFYDTVQALPAGSFVLVSFDYDPGTSGEIEPQAKAILHHLLQQNLQIAALSLVPEGPTLAQNLFSELIPQYPDYEYGKNYINLGLLTGREAGLRVLIRDLRLAMERDYRDDKPLITYPMTQNIQGLDDIALIVDLAGSQDPVRLWVEQVGSQGKTPIVAGVTAVAEPSLEPYLQSGQLRGLISGLAGAAEYELITNRPARAVASMDAQSAVHFLIFVVVILGTIVPVLVKRRG